MVRPVWEPPVIDMDGYFDQVDKNFDGDVIGHVRKQIRNPSLRCDFWDLWCEVNTLLEYEDWPKSASRAAAAHEDKRGVLYCCQ